MTGKFVSKIHYYYRYREQFAPFMSRVKAVIFFFSEEIPETSGGGIVVRRVWNCDPFLGHRSQEGTG